MVMDLPSALSSGAYGVRIKTARMDPRLACIGLDNRPFDYELGRKVDDSPDDLLYALMHKCAISAAKSSGYALLHGSAISIDGRTLVVLGDRGAGKSTLCAYAHSQGDNIVADDLVLTDGAKVFAGPRLLALKPDDGRAEPMYRLARPVNATSPLAGLMLLAWGAYLGSNAMTPSQCQYEIQRHTVVAGQSDWVPELALRANIGLAVRRPYHISTSEVYNLIKAKYAR